MTLKFPGKKKLSHHTPICRDIQYKYKWPQLNKKETYKWIAFEHVNHAFEHVVT